jgi:4-amino-4-deoxy-L-arabinose transferase-like glycosyltransferase
VRAHPLRAILLLALALRAYPWFLPHTLYGVMEVDDGVYYASSKMLLHGLIPYRDFTILHPPVTSVLLLPFAGLGSLLGDPAGMAAARLAIGFVGLMNVLLVHRLAVRLRLGPRAALLAALVYAVMPDAVVAEHTVLLEPLVNLCCLLAVLLLLQSRWVPLVGALLSAAVGIKVFAGAYVMGVLIWLVLSNRRALLRPVVLGLVLGGLVLIGPFFALAPSELFHDIVTTQLSRPTDNTPGGLVFLLDQVLPHVLSLLVVVGLFAGVVLGARRWERRHPSSGTTLWLLVGGIGVIAFACSPSYFPHYGAFLVPPLAMVLAVLSSRRAPIVLLLVLIFLVSSVVDDVTQTGQRDLRLAAGIPEGSCVFYEGISLAVAADALEVPSSSCPAWIDGRGVSLTWNTDWDHADEYYPFGFRDDARWQRETVDQLSHASFLLLTEDVPDIGEWTARTQAYALAHFTPVWTENTDVQVQVWKRTR